VAEHDCLNDALATLKDFQRATVERIRQSLFVEKRKAILVADEVGLGKTIVARGVIAKALQQAAKTGKDTYRVTYVCSNQAIARENEGKLNPFPEAMFRPQPVRRMALLAYQPTGAVAAPNGVTFELNTMTPSTSFDSRSGTGIADERCALAYLLMNGDSFFADRPEGVACLVRNGIGQPRLEQWIESFATDWKAKGLTLRPGLASDFIETISNLPIPTDLEFPVTLTSSSAPPANLLECAKFLAGRLSLANHSPYRPCNDRVVGALREALIEKCVTFLNTDLFILDEFQRFRHLLKDPEDPEDPEDSEASRIASAAFSGVGTHVLLLSATPFKAFSGQDDNDVADVHYKEFKVILKFLLQGDGEALNQYEKSRQRLYHQFGSLTSGSLTDIDDTAKREVETILRPIMCRTERCSVVETLGQGRSEEPDTLPASPADIANYVDSDRIAAAIGQDKPGAGQVMPVEYCKSTPFVFSFLRDYKLRTDLVSALKRGIDTAAISAPRNAWLNVKAMDRYRLELSNGEPTHARLDALMGLALDQDAHLLLWVPPSLPYYPLSGVFSNAEGYTKTLVFSAWRMVPRMIAGLISYEVERQTIGDENTRDRSREEAKRKYFTERLPGVSRRRRRHPRPQIVFRAEHDVLQELQNTCLLYPCMTYTEAVRPQSFVGMHESQDWRATVRQRLTELLEPILTRYARPNGNSDAWYWAAGPLLDRDNADARAWLVDRSKWRESTFFNASKDSEDDSRKSEFFQRLQACMTATPEELRLGPPPTDLIDVLLDVAVGSPPVSALRSLRNLYPEVGIDKLLTKSLNIGSAFVSLFNKPESIAALRLAVPNEKSYWRQVLAYCTAGCLQSTLDEYFHLLKEQFRAIDDALEVACDSVNVRTSSVVVDDHRSIVGDQPYRMRSHFAVDFGSKRLAMDEGENRAKSLRHSFNSPFRPFVLASTSIGQEGLDFHLYCRRVVHWNLPSNPIDLEQREGRVDRFKGLSIRQGIASAYRSLLQPVAACRDLWSKLFGIAVQYEHAGEDRPDLIPYWILAEEESSGFPIERIVPVYPFSKEADQYKDMLKTLAVYRLTFGQPRQAELARFLECNFTPEEIKTIREKLMVDLCPLRYTQSGYVNAAMSY